MKGGGGPCHKHSECPAGPGSPELWLLPPLLTFELSVEAISDQVRVRDIPELQITATLTSFPCQEHSISSLLLLNEISTFPLFA